MRKHILFFIESLSSGGAEKVLVTLLNHLDYSKYEVTLMTLVDTGVLKDDIDFTKLNYVPVIREAKTPLQRLWNNIKYKLIYHYLPCRLTNRWIVPQKGIDVYIAFTEGFSTKLISYTPKKKLAWVHADLKTDPWTLNSKIYSNLAEERTSYSQYNKVICVSKSVEQIMKDYYGVKRVLTIYNPIDTEDIINKAKQPIKFVIPSSFNIVSVGRLVYQKGYDRLVSVISRLNQKGIDVQLFIIGEGSERKNLEKIIHNKGLQNVVHLVGYLNNPYALMSKMDLFVCSSLTEGYSLVIAEAMTLGLPVISTNCVGPSEILDSSKYGLIVENSEQGLYDGLNAIIKDFKKLKGLKQKSLERSKSFGINNSIYAFDSLVD